MSILGTNASFILLGIEAACKVTGSINRGSIDEAARTVGIEPANGYCVPLVDYLLKENLIWEDTGSGFFELTSQGAAVCGMLRAMRGPLQ